MASHSTLTAHCRCRMSAAAIMTMVTTTDAVVIMITALIKAGASISMVSIIGGTTTIITAGIITTN